MAPSRTRSDGVVGDAPVVDTAAAVLNSVARKSRPTLTSGANWGSMEIGSGQAGEVVRRIRDDDPLAADEMCARVPAMNRSKDVGALLSALHTVIPTEAGIAGFDAMECVAAMRDLGLFLGSSNDTASNRWMRYQKRDCP